MSDNNRPNPPFSKDTACLTILIADDNALNHAILSSLLQNMGHKVITASTGLGAIESLKNNDCDLILMDIQMPEMDGITATVLIRAMLGPKSTTPIIACTGDSLEKHIKEYQHAGMNSILSKPMQKDDLICIINDYLYDRLHFPSRRETKIRSKDIIYKTSASKTAALENLLKEIGG